MRKDGPPPPSTTAKIFLCFETKPFLATLLVLTLLILVWNLQPYYENLLAASSRCSAAVAFAANTTITNFNTTSPTANSTTKSLPIRSAVNVTSTSNKLVRSPPADPNKRTSNKLVRSPPADPNKRTFEAYGNAAALFVKMGAYRGGPRTFAIVGLASKPVHVFGRPWYKCEWIPNGGGPSIRAKAYKMLPDWGYGRVYTVVVVNCTFLKNPNADNRGGRLMVNAYYGLSPRRYEKFTALEEAAGAYNESVYRAPYPYEYLYCGSSLYGNLSASRIREWMAYHAWFFGERSHFVFHDAGGVSAEVRGVLEPWIRAGRVTVQDIRAQAEYDGYYYNQFLVVNDCLHRHRHAANWTFYFDVDEYMYVEEGNSLHSVLQELSNYTQFTIEQKAMSSFLCLNDSTQDYPKQWGLEKLVFRDSRRIRRDRKYAIQARNAMATGVHMSENVIGRSLHKTETKIRYYHYHNSIMVHQELCRKLIPMSAGTSTTWVDKIPYVFDDTMKKLATTIKDFELKAIGPQH